ncbi:hypothetical protein ASZ90_007770 [hydrocarbon metagenome]|uniref:Uncharacterized protein n=1 Tax=hydrocarbon metagenome TaxID=938273 RepID=A0A0W8FNF9_9ZZZZ
MGNFKKREIIILAIATVFVLYAGYEFLIARPADKKVQTSANVDPAKKNTSLSDLTNELSKDKLSDLDAYMVKKIESDWNKNPFWKKDLYKEWAAKEDAAKGGSTAPKIIYSGYVDSGKNKMAVINGLEYRIGEQLEIEGYFLKQITPSKVVILNKNSGDREEVPLQE